MAYRYKTTMGSSWSAWQSFDGRKSFHAPVISVAVDSFGYDVLYAGGHP
jgi:hypothetical protein